MSALTFLWVYLITIAVSLLVAVVIRLLTWVTGRFPENTPKPVESAAPVADTNAIAPEVVAAIAGALHNMAGEHRIVHIGLHHGANWTGEVRQMHHHSHNPLQHQRHSPR